MRKCIQSVYIKIVTFPADPQKLLFMTFLKNGAGENYLKYYKPLMITFMRKFHST